MKNTITTGRDGTVIYWPMIEAEANPAGGRERRGPRRDRLATRPVCANGWLPQRGDLNDTPWGEGGIGYRKTSPFGAPTTARSSAKGRLLASRSSMVLVARCRAGKNQLCARGRLYYGEAVWDGLVLMAPCKVTTHAVMMQMPNRAGAP